MVPLTLSAAWQQFVPSTQLSPRHFLHHLPLIYKRALLVSKIHL
jgi:hypothetical protein